MELFHLTNEDNLYSITRKGLLPRTGRNSAYAREAQDHVYMCMEKDVPYWQIMLGKDCLFSVEVEGLPIGARFYTVYTEFLCDDPIDPSRIRFIGQLSKPRKKFMETICTEHLGIVSEACSCVASYYSEEPKVTLEQVKTVLSEFDFIKDNLDYGAVPVERLQAKVKALKDLTGFSFTDVYADVNRRVWETLPLHPRDELSALRINLYKFIRNRLEGCNQTDTGYTEHYYLPA